NIFTLSQCRERLYMESVDQNQREFFGNIAWKFVSKSASRHARLEAVHRQLFRFRKGAIHEETSVSVGGHWIAFRLSRQLDDVQQAEAAVVSVPDGWQRQDD